MVLQTSVCDTNCETVIAIAKFCFLVLPVLNMVYLTVDSRVGPTDGRDGRPPGHYELVVLADVVSGLGLGEDEILKVQSGIPCWLRRE